MIAETWHAPFVRPAAAHPLATEFPAGRRLLFMDRTVVVRGHAFRLTARGSVPVVQCEDTSDTPGGFGVSCYLPDTLRAWNGGVK